MSSNPFSEGPERAIRNYLASRISDIGCLMSCRYELKTMEQAEKLATLLASQCPVPERISTGIWELLSNAVEHGNLEITYEEKAELMRTGMLAMEIERRLHLPEFAGRVVSVDFCRMKNSIRIRICDEGPGFDHVTFLSEPCSLEGPNGRGIFIAKNISFDKLVYHGAGNVVDGIVLI